MRPALLSVALPVCPHLFAGCGPVLVSAARPAGAELRLFPSDAGFKRRPRGGSAGRWAPSTWRPRFQAELIGSPGDRLLGRSVVVFLVGSLGPVWCPPPVWPHCLVDASRVWRFSLLAVAPCSE